MPYHNGGPRVLVGTPTLDHMLDLITTRRIQHVIDFGRVYKLRQDTGNDWEEAFITQSMAEGRLAAAQSSAPGLCLRVYVPCLWPALLTKVRGRQAAGNIPVAHIAG